MTSAVSVANEIENVLDYMMNEAIAFYRRPVRHAAGVVTWQPNSVAIPFLPQREQHSVALYRHWITNGHYSAVLFDGSLLQFSYEYASNTLIAHRLAYVPAPAWIDPDVVAEFGIYDVVEAELDDIKRVRFASTVRFELDLAGAAPGHPAAHMTLNSPDCRVPCMTPMRLGMFLRFILGQFYPNVWDEHPFFESLATSGLGRRTITHEEAGGLHIAWPA